jgi:hypothetical protein
MKVLDVLSDESKWVRDKVAVNTQGIQVAACDPSSARWCIVGAVAKVCDNCLAYSAIMRKISKSVDKLFPQFKLDEQSIGDNAIEFNNHPATTYQDLRAVLEDAGV